MDSQPRLPASGTSNRRRIVRVLILAVTLAWIPTAYLVGKVTGVVVYSRAASFGSNYVVTGPDGRQQKIDATGIQHRIAKAERFGFYGVSIVYLLAMIILLFEWSATRNS